MAGWLVGWCRVHGAGCTIDWSYRSPSTSEASVGSSEVRATAPSPRCAPPDCHPAGGGSALGLLTGQAYPNPRAVSPPTSRVAAGRSRDRFPRSPASPDPNSLLSPRSGSEPSPDSLLGPRPPAPSASPAWLSSPAAPNCSQLLPTAPNCSSRPTPALPHRAAVAASNRLSGQPPVRLPSKR